MSSAVENLPASAGSVAVYSAKEIKAHVQLIQQVMKAVMKQGTHFGTIPGTPKPSLWKPGAEVLCTTFRIAPSFRIDDLSDHDSVRYRVTCVGTHQVTGVVLGEGMGEASSNEEKYKWRNAVCAEEFEEMAEDRRRAKWQRSKDDGPYQRKQIRTEPADIANTVLKMACKRAQVAMAINVTAASDIFTQDLEDMPEELRPGSDEADEAEQRPRGRPTTQTPQARSSSGGNGGGTGKCSDKQAAMLRKRLESSGIAEEDFLQQFEVQAIADLPWKQVDSALQWITNAR